MSDKLLVDQDHTASKLISGRAKILTQFCLYYTAHQSFAYFNSFTIVTNTSINISRMKFLSSCGFLRRIP